MSDDSQQARARSEPVRSFFPPSEPSSFCSRPTPVVPASDDLRDFGFELVAQESSGPHPIATPSSRPTVGPGELEAYTPPASDRPTLSHDEIFTEMLERAMVGAPLASSPLPAEPEPMPSLAPGLPRQRGRILLSRALFTLLFGAVVALLGYAFQPRIAQFVHQARGVLGH
jgi:hypothetical protein